MSIVVSACADFSGSQLSETLVHRDAEIAYLDDLSAGRGNVNSIGPRGVHNEAKRLTEAITLACRRTCRVNTVVMRIVNTCAARLRSPVESAEKGLRRSVAYLTTLRSSQLSSAAVMAA